MNASKSLNKFPIPLKRRYKYSFKEAENIKGKLKKEKTEEDFAKDMQTIFDQQYAEDIQKQEYEIIAI